ncbi:hypothetical protein DFH11DRAFT_1575467, partial [Phellopilus nigrolimitatus]
VIVSNIANKSRGIRSDIRAARNLLNEAAADLHEMREGKCANINRELDTGYGLLADANKDIYNFIRQTIGTHDRSSLSKKLPQTLSIPALPQTFQKFIH